MMIEDVEIKMSGWSPATLITQKSQNRATLDLSFRDVSYTVGKGNSVKQILHKLSGTFKSGQLTAILGPSGAGKTSLMNILGGLKKSGAEGKVQVNGIKRDSKTFRKQSAYITQEDYLLQHLTVDEYMLSAAHLKLGNDVSNEEKKSNIEIVMKTLGLMDSRRTRISCLSGGECKRLSIGLELIDNPAILFLDEPTSGLDSSSSLQCLALLREIARSGRTVISTIHQPSSRLLDYFDHLYIVADGSCMYQGPVASLVSFFKTMNLNCPSYHNPADFAMDVACGEYGDVVPVLVSAIENGRLIYEESLTPTFATPSSLSHDTGFYDEDDDMGLLDSRSKKKEKNTRELVYSAPFQTQVAILLKRTWRTIWREKILSLLRFILHVVVGGILGLIYWQIGDDAEAVLYNAAFIYLSMLFIIFAAGMPTVVTFPLERKVLVREHLNNWYSLKAYYLAKTIADIPFQIVFPTVFLLIVYPLTNQPMNIGRFGMFLSMIICMALLGQGIGLLFGAAFGIHGSVFIASMAILPFTLYSGFFLKLSKTPAYLSWILDISFMRYAFEGSMLSVYGFDRPLLSCSQPYCRFRNPITFLELFDMAQGSFYWCLFGQLVTFLVIRIAGYFVLRFKLKCTR